MGIRGHAPDGVAGVDVLEVYLPAAALEIVFDRIPEEDADIAVLYVSRRVPLSRFFHQVLSGTLCNNHNRMVSPFEPLS